MEYWVEVKFDYCGDPMRNHVQEIKTNRYFRENDDGTILEINVPTCIKVLSMFGSDLVIKGIKQEEFEKVLKDTVKYMDIDITTHKFI